MGENKKVKAVRLVRRIRDKQARLLSGKTDEEILAYFRKAGESVRRRKPGKQTSQTRRATSKRVELRARRSNRREGGREASSRSHS